MGWEGSRMFWSLNLLLGHASQGFLLTIKPGVCSIPGHLTTDEQFRPLGQSPPFSLRGYRLVARPILMALKALQQCRVTLGKCSVTMHMSKTERKEQSVPGSDSLPTPVASSSLGNFWPVLSFPTAAGRSRHVGAPSASVPQTPEMCPGLQPYPRVPHHNPWPHPGPSPIRLSSVQLSHGQGHRFLFPRLSQASP